MRELVSKHIRVPVTQKEHSIIKQRAYDAGLTMAEYLRQLGLRGWVIQRGVVEIQKLLWEINKIGTNINQVVYLANQNKSISSYQLDKIQEEHRELWDLLDKFVEPIKILGADEDIGD